MDDEQEDAAFYDVRMISFAGISDAAMQCFDMTYSDGDSQWECAEGIQSGFADVSVSECAAYMSDGTEMCGTSMCSFHGFSDENGIVRAVHGDSTADPIDVILDSGADVSVLPEEMSCVGSRAPARPEKFKDAQGNDLRISQRRIADIHVQSNTGTFVHSCEGISSLGFCVQAFASWLAGRY